jgi:urease accessory protein
MTALFPPTNPPGYGTVQLSAKPSQFRILSYAYPLKLISPTPIEVTTQRTVQTLFLLTYGGGLVAGDSVTLSIELDAATNLILLTQGSTKIFKTPDSTGPLTTQSVTAKLARNSALCYIPDPVQPFAKSAFAQKQRFELGSGASLCVCDWVTSGRPARDEIWAFWKYESGNEVWTMPDDGTLGRLLLRDNMILDNDTDNRHISEPLHGHKIDHLGVYGTLILRGPVFKGLGQFFIEEFRAMPRIGEKRWDDDDSTKVKPTAREEWRKQRLKHEAEESVLWTAAQVRNCTLIKFGSREVEGSRRWLRSMLVKEGTVEEHFGERSTLCLR